ncbi:hypothetical protein MAR_009041 [Mya arenaria]|uniref:Uncharacterized protein n=1 Tax=Mya arenaria TaxID=6604 RepID=A0ABY7E0W5_MYAAR|nr:hypothetical protein MAR_009041 [Mya arenaria]
MLNPPSQWSRCMDKEVHLCTLPQARHSPTFFRLATTKLRLRAHVNTLRNTRKDFKHQSQRTSRLLPCTARRHRGCDSGKTTPWLVGRIKNTPYIHVSYPIFQKDLNSEYM